MTFTTDPIFGLAKVATSAIHLGPAQPSFDNSEALKQRKSMIRVPSAKYLIDGCHMEKEQFKHHCPLLNVQKENPKRFSAAF